MEYSIAVAKTLRARTVHIKLFPTPRSFPERREVLRVLERYGEVSMFRSLKYNRKHQIPVHNAFIALFAHPDSAKELREASPLRYQIVKDPADTSSPTNPESEAPLSQQEPQTTVFSLSASSSTYDHQKALTGSQNPLHGPFRPISPRYSYIGSSLQRTIPESLWSKGLLDWETDKGDDVLNGLQDGVRLSTAGEEGARRMVALQNQTSMKIGEKHRPAIMYGLRRFVQQKAEIPHTPGH